LLKVQKLQFLFSKPSKYALGQRANESKYLSVRLLHRWLPNDYRVCARGYGV